MKLFVPLTRTEFDKLHDLAQLERRRPQDQAALILAHALADYPFQTAVDADPAPGVKVTTDRRSRDTARVSA